MLKAVLRYLDGAVTKGYVDEFNPFDEIVAFYDTLNSQKVEVPFVNLKAIFFVKTFEGDPQYNERRFYGVGPGKGKKIFIRFKDGESIVGFTRDDLPWDKGFFLSQPKDNRTGFYVYPADSSSNNDMIYVIISSVVDITLVG